MDELPAGRLIQVALFPAGVLPSAGGGNEPVAARRVGLRPGEAGPLPHGGPGDERKRLSEKKAPGGHFPQPLLHADGVVGRHGDEFPDVFHEKRSFC